MEKQCKQCGKVFKIPKYRFETAKYCNKKCSDLGAKGQLRSPNTQFKKGSSGFNGNHSIQSRQKMRNQKLKNGSIREGYKVIIPTLGGIQIKEHRYIWEQVNGKIPKGYIIHHKNGNKLDNRIENLECISNSEHTKLHHQLGNISGGIQT